MSTPQQPHSDQRALRLHWLSLLLARFALISAIPLCAALAILLGIIYYPPPCSGGGCTPIRVILTLPITGLPALLLQQGPFALMGLAGSSLLLTFIRRWQTRQRRKKAGVSLPSETPLLEPGTPPAAAPPSVPTHTPKLWRRPISLAVLSLVLVALMLCTLVPLSSTAFNDIGEIVLYSVSMVSADEGWAVGAFDQFSIGNVRGVIWQYHNGQWTSMLSPTKSLLTGVSTLPDGEAWAVGFDGTMLHEYGGAWTQEASGTTDDLQSIVMISPTEGWAVGGTYPLASANNRFVAGISAPAAHSRFNPAVASRPRDESFCTILHYTASRWSPVTCPVMYPLNSVAVLPDGEAWAVGDDGILHERQGVWKQVKSPATVALRSIALVSSTEGWAVGDTADAPTLLHYLNGVWTTFPTSNPYALGPMAISSTGEGWMVGGSDGMLHLSQGTWQYVPNPKWLRSDDYLYAVTLLPGGQEGWAMGANQLILHLHNGVWSLYSRQASSKLPQ